MNSSAGFNFSGNNYLTSMDKMDFNLSADTNLTRNLFTNCSTACCNLTSLLNSLNFSRDHFETDSSDSNSDTIWLEKTLEDLKNDKLGSPFLHLLLMAMSFASEALATFFTKIKEKPPFQTGIPMLTKVLHNTSCTGVYTFKNTVSSLVMSVFVQNDPWLCVSIILGSALGQMVCNWIDTDTDTDLAMSKGLPSDTDLNIDMDMFEDKVRDSPLGEEHSAVKGEEDAPKVVQQSFISSSATVPFSKITLPDFTSPPSPPSPPPPLDSKSPIRYQKPLYGSLDSGVSMESGPRQVGPKQDRRTGPNPGIKSGPSPSRSKGPDKRLDSDKMNIPRSYISSGPGIFQQGTPVSTFIGGSRVYRGGSNPDLSKGSKSSLAAGSNPDLRSGPATNIKSVSNPNLGPHPTPSKRIGSNSSLKTGPSTNLRTGPNPNLRSGPTSSLSMGSNSSLRTGSSTGTLKRAHLNSDLGTDASSISKHDDLVSEEDQHNEFVGDDIIPSEDTSALESGTIGTEESEREQQNRTRPIPRKRSSLEESSRQRPFESSSNITSSADSKSDTASGMSGYDPNTTITSPAVGNKFNKEGELSSTSPSMSPALAGNSISNFDAHGGPTEQNSYRPRRSSSRRSLPMAPDQTLNSKK